MEIKEKRGVWYVINPPEPKKAFKSEKDAKAYVKGDDPVKPKKSDDMWADLV